MGHQHQGKAPYPGHVFSSSLENAKVLVMAKGGTGSQSSLESENLDLLLEGRRRASIFLGFLPPCSLLHLEAAFFPFLRLFQEYAK